MRILLSCLLLVVAGCSTVPPITPEIELQAWGAPWTRRIAASVSDTGAARITVDDPNRRFKKRNMYDFSLTRDELQSVRTAAATALASCDTSKNREQIACATRVRLIIHHGNRQTECILDAKGRAEDASPQFARVIRLLNIHLSEQYEIW